MVFQGLEEVWALKLGALWAAWGAKVAWAAKGGLGQSCRRSQESHFDVSRQIFRRNWTLLEIHEKPKEKHGFSRVRGGLGTQIGATLGRPGRQSGTSRWHGRPKVDSDRAAGGVRRVILTSQGQLFGEVGHCLKYMKNTWKSIVFQGLEGIWASKSEPLGPQSCAHEGSGAVKVASQRARRAKKERLESTCLSELWKRIGPGCESSGNQIGSGHRAFRHLGVSGLQPVLEIPFSISSHDSILDLNL